MHNFYVVHLKIIDVLGPFRNGLLSPCKIWRAYVFAAENHVSFENRLCYNRLSTSRYFNGKYHSSSKAKTKYISNTDPGPMKKHQ